MICRIDTKLAEQLQDDDARACVILLQTNAQDDGVFEEALEAATSIFAEQGLKCVASTQNIQLDTIKEDCIGWIRVNVRQEAYSYLESIRMRKGKDIEE